MIFTFSKLTINEALCTELLLQINAAIKQNNLIIQSKIDNPYVPCEQKIQSVSTLLAQLNSALESLENERIEYNKNITDTKPIINRLHEINKLIAHFDIQDFYLKYLECAAQAKIEGEKLNEKR